MLIAILAFSVFVITTVLYTVLGSMYHIKINFVAIYRVFFYVYDYDNPISINECVMHIDGEYVDNNLDVWDSYADKQGSSGIQYYIKWIVQEAFLIKTEV